MLRNPNFGGVFEYAFCSKIKDGENKIMSLPLLQDESCTEIESPEQAIFNHYESCDKRFSTTMKAVTSDFQPLWQSKRFSTTLKNGMFNSFTNCRWQHIRQAIVRRSKLFIIC